MMDDSVRRREGAAERIAASWYDWHLQQNTVAASWARRELKEMVRAALTAESTIVYQQGRESVGRMLKARADVVRSEGADWNITGQETADECADELLVMANRAHHSEDDQPDA